MKKVIIAEKPSLAMTIVQAIGGNFNRYDGYFENDKYIMGDRGRIVADRLLWR